MGALITAILVVNNLRDIPTDAAAGKRTLAVALGRRATAVEYGLLLALAFAVPVALLLAGPGIAQLLLSARRRSLHRCSARFAASPSRGSSTPCWRGPRGCAGVRGALRGRACAAEVAVVTDLTDPAGLRRRAPGGPGPRAVCRPRPRSVPAAFATATECGFTAKPGSCSWRARTAGSGSARPSLEPDATEVEETLLARLVREAADARGPATCPTPRSWS